MLIQKKWRSPFTLFWQRVKSDLLKLLSVAFTSTVRWPLSYDSDSVVMFWSLELSVHLCWAAFSQELTVSLYWSAFVTGTPSTYALSVFLVELQVHMYWSAFITGTPRTCLKYFLSGTPLTYVLKCLCHWISQILCTKVLFLLELTVHMFWSAFVPRLPVNIYWSAVLWIVLIHMCWNAFSLEVELPVHMYWSTLFY